MITLSDALEIFLHFDDHLSLWVSSAGGWIYIIVFLIIFCESGIVLLPFLPGDSLLFALGALSALENSELNLYLLGVSLFVAAVLGGLLNYACGRMLSDRIVKRGQSLWINREHLNKTSQYYETHGGKTVVLARFIPIIRTFAPFVAGLAPMNFGRFALFNLLGGALWISSLIYLGRTFGNLPIIKDNFGLVIPGIILISIVPVIIEKVRPSKKTNKDSDSDKSSKIPKAL